MAKLNAKQRIQTVIRYLNGIESMQDIAESVGVTRMILSGWIRLYEAQGPEGFLQSYTNYSAAFKMEVLTYMNETGASSIDAAAIFNISSPEWSEIGRRSLKWEDTMLLFLRKRGGYP